MHTDHYVQESLELHLFFGRIMKEHSLFLKAGFTPANSEFSAKAEFYRREFETLLNRAVSLANGIISREVLNSGELVTAFTYTAERQTQTFTGIPINSGITERELGLSCGNSDISESKFCQTRKLNETAARLLDGLISLKEAVLDRVRRCQMFTMNYPLLLEHIIREAKLYRSYLQQLETEGTICGDAMKESECFWNQIMMEHALFIRGLLDPTETELIQSANQFAEDYGMLLQKCRGAQNRTMHLSMNSLSETKKFRELKAAGTQGITACKIRSLILPLLADHVLREANHFIRLLEH